MSECLYVTCASPRDPEEKRNQCDGRAVGTCQIQIRDPEDDMRQLPPGRVGHIVIKAPSIMLRYFKRPELTAQSYTSDGWFRTGDLGALDEDGFLTIRGRLKDLVLRGGENIPVIDVELLLLEHPGIIDASVVGVPDDRLGEKVCAVVVCEQDAPPLDIDDLRAYLTNKGMTRQFVPEYLVVRDCLPKTVVGKTRKHDVRRIAVTELGLHDEASAGTPLEASQGERR